MCHHLQVTRSKVCLLATRRCRAITRSRWAIRPAICPCSRGIRLAIPRAILSSLIPDNPTQGSPIPASQECPLAMECRPIQAWQQAHCQHLSPCRQCQLIWHLNKLQSQCPQPSLHLPHRLGFPRQWRLRCQSSRQHLFPLRWKPRRWSRMVCRILSIRLLLTISAPSPSAASLSKCGRRSAVVP